ncbi:MAG TPA: glycine cleavage T C-terminal barrel domain-containing protein, partial [Burkholderiales bacterium]|nr:glycine cleavage T C-terminal barrel domain-containing protein [Burkholderiales bacterium]
EDGSVFNDATAWRLDAQRWWLFTGRRSDSRRLRGIARDRSGEYAIAALQGPASARILARMIGAEAVRKLRYFRFVEKENLIIARLGYSGELGYELLVPRAESKRVWDALLEAGRPDELRECSFEAANSLRIESGYVLFDREIDGRANPSELGLERLAGRKFEVSRKLIGLEILAAAPRADLPLARVTSECFSPILGKQIALGFAPPQAHEGSELRLEDGRAARAAPLPFYDSDRRRPRAAPL